ncbi:membrane fusion protein, multidrug efflux system [Aquiflexum balticum DSM 16537]|uniref:Membrane fusion protein, multidrug efflux system n=1 Tax=Aquiflexum balticum DSM 16537 TaxID=758820 RepID=A0A1W2H5U8_9BACT|nr:efflux RND transporter periplasmic adaptor subunit [Aquiflexum balticum]SMD44293.1 membrane fusion protein, multidrug efflux system [Aquiflexum balticum DSM 16537]
MKSKDLGNSHLGLMNNLLKKSLSFLLLIFCLNFYSCSNSNSKEKDQLILENIPVLELTAKTIEFPKTYVCEIQAVQFVEIRAKVEGYVDRIYVDEGQFVKKGQTLLQLSSLEFNEMVNSANAKLAQAQAEAQAASVEMQRLQILVEKDIISPSELELAKSKKSVAESGIVEAESMLKNAQTNLSYTTIKAPYDGIVDRFPKKTGALVTPGDLLTNITDVNEVFAYFKVTENEYLRYMRAKLEGESLTSNQDVTLILSDGEVYEYTGKLETMEADFERGTGSIAFRVRFPNPDQLIKHGASGKIQLSNQMENIFLIPQKSTFEIQDYSYVYILDKDNQVKVRSFKPLQRYGVYYIAEGFEEGDRIIYEGIQQVKDGIFVNPAMVSDKEAYDTLSSFL